MTTEILTTTPDSEIVSSRIVNASRELVFRAWTEPEHLKKWWGPAGFTNTFHEFDFRVGGKWSFIMHGPDKGNYPNECEFIKIEVPSLIAWKRHSKPLFQILAAFEEVSSEKTKIVFKMLFNSAEECNKLKPFVVDKNEENFDRLENKLKIMAQETR
ncbi:SRPBCC family protein [Flavobacterium sp. HJJ]|uniref:SRPBCC family protein n=1 Tax=Flavobacterium sp. HJJ TaxID=2783792 RepID=UPI00188C1A36|nr:SRPBCC family protein [Flavobacterium sp. HJJ]MBF4471321.1 SRPBCC family protein [Flavobacterium sp. HJJ]